MTWKFSSGKINSISITERGSMPDYLVYKAGNRLVTLLHEHYREEDLLLKNYTPGGDLVLIPNVIGVNPHSEAERLADLYFRGQYQQTRSIECWVEGAKVRQACLRAS